MASVLIRNIGQLVSGDLANPLLPSDALYIQDGVFAEIGTERTDADTVIDANGLTVTPGLIDSHAHPTFGDQHTLLNASGWIRAYLHGSGVTSMVSAGEQHIPGIPYEEPQAPQALKHEALFARRAWQRVRPSGVKVHAGTMLMVPGLQEQDFDDLAAAGCENVKFIFYPFHRDWSEGQRYLQWARERGIVSKFHTGGVSRTGVSQPAFAKEVVGLNPDVAGHITGGPIAMGVDDLEAIVRDSEVFLEIVAQANYRRQYELINLVEKYGAWERVIVGTDTPTGAGFMPRGILRVLLFLSGVGGLAPERAIALASGNVARAHRLKAGTIAVGQPADLLIMGTVRGSVAPPRDALESIRQGDLPGIAVILIDGKVVVRDRAEQTPPPELLPTFVKG